MASSGDYIPSSIVDALQSDTQLAIFLRVDTVPPLHLYFGVNDIPAGFDSIDPDGTVYLGGGRLSGVPSLEVLVNGTSDAVDFTLSGIDPTTAAAALDSLPPVRGAEVNVGLTILDRYYQPISAIVPIWTGVASHLSEASQSVPAGKDPTLSLSLAVVSGEATRSRGARSMWTSAHQKAISPTDKFCDATARLARGVAPTWPNY